MALPNNPLKRPGTTAAKPAETAAKPATPKKPVAPPPEEVVEEEAAETQVEEKTSSEIEDQSTDYVEPPVTRQVSTARTGAERLPVKTPAHTPPSTSLSTQVLPAVEDDGFGGLEESIGFGSYDVLKLEGNEFSVAGNTVPGDPGLYGRIQQGRKKWLFKASEDKEEENIVYSYDKVNNANNTRALADIFEEWVAEGKMDPNHTPTGIQYYEAVVQLLHDVADPNEENRAKIQKATAGDVQEVDLVLASVAPTSVARLAGLKNKLKMRGEALPDVVVRLTIGKKIQTKGGKSYYPWEFKRVGKYVDLCPQDDE